MRTGTRYMAALPLACFLSFLCLSGLASAASDFNVLASAASDFNVLTLLWPGAQCNNPLSGCCLPTTGQPALDFYVQALETYDSATGKPVTNCNATCRFYVNALRNIISELYAYWPDVSCPSNNGKDAWQSTWCTYGPCSTLDQLNYFNRSLVLRANVDPLFILHEYDIVPSNDKKYRLQDIQDALLPSLGFSFYIECNRNYLWFFESQLYKIHICVSADAKRLITCPISTKSNCDDEVRFVPFTANMLKGVNDNPIKMPSGQDMPM